MGFNSVFKGLNTQHVSSDIPLIIRSSKNVIAASGLTFVAASHWTAVGNHKRPAQAELCAGRNI
jgi:hypothetical protein